jgi:hypothetical protein
MFRAVLSWSDRQKLLFHGSEAGNGSDWGDGGGPVEASAVDADDDWEDEDMAGLSNLPPGEEGFLQSHAGGEAILQQLLDGMAHS